MGHCLVASQSKFVDSTLELTAVDIGEHHAQAEIGVAGDARDGQLRPHPGNRYPDIVRVAEQRVLGS